MDHIVLNFIADPYVASTPKLARAAAEGNVEEMKRLLSKKCSPETPDNRGYTTLHYCVLSNQLEALELILKKLEKGKNPESVNLVSRAKVSPLFLALAITKPCIDTVRLLLEFGACPNRSPHTKVTPLHLACSKKGNLKFVQLLVDFGANVNQQEYCKLFTPLHISISKARDLDIIEYLLKLSDLSLKNYYGQTAFHTACSMNWLEAVNLFLKQNPRLSKEKADLSPLAYAGLAGNLAMADALINAGFDVNVQTKAILPSRNSDTEVILLDSDIFYPLHSTLKNIKLFEKILKLTKPSELLKTNHYYYGFPIFVMCYGGPDFFEVLLQSNYPKELKSVSVHSLIVAIIKYPEIKNLLFENFRLFFKYNFNIDPPTVFKHLCSQVSVSSMSRCYDFFYLLARMGVSSVNEAEGNNHIIFLLESCLLSCNDSESWNMIHRTCDLLSKSIPTLQHYCRLVVRRTVFVFRKDNWLAYQWIKNCDFLPRNVKRFLLYEFL